MGILSGNPKHEPLHYGEVYGVWMSLHAAKAALDGYYVYVNHTGDDDLKRFLREMIDDIVKPEIEEMEQLMLHNDIAVPPTPSERPQTDVEQIPVGARMNDVQIANVVAAGIALGLTAYSKMIGEAIREDVVAMFERFHMKKLKKGAVLLQMLKDKGWLVPPPLHQNTKQE